MYASRRVRGGGCKEGDGEIDAPLVNNSFYPSIRERGAVHRSRIFGFSDWREFRPGHPTFYHQPLRSRRITTGEVALLTSSFYPLINCLTSILGYYSGERCNGDLNSSLLIIERSMSPCSCTTSAIRNRQSRLVSHFQTEWYFKVKLYTGVSHVTS